MGIRKKIKNEIKHTKEVLKDKRLNKHQLDFYLYHLATLKDLLK